MSIVVWRWRWRESEREGERKRERMCEHFHCSRHKTATNQRKKKKKHIEIQVEKFAAIDLCPIKFNPISSSWNIEWEKKYTRAFSSYGLKWSSINSLNWVAFIDTTYENVINQIPVQIRLSEIQWHKFNQICAKRRQTFKICFSVTFENCHSTHSPTIRSLPNSYASCDGHVKYEFRLESFHIKRSRRTLPYRIWIRTELVWCVRSAP